MESPGKFESSNVSRDNVSREIGRINPSIGTIRFDLNGFHVAIRPLHTCLRHSVASLLDKAIISIDVGVCPSAYAAADLCANILDFRGSYSSLGVAQTVFRRNHTSFVGGRS